ncbi:MAG: 4Fe-4S binding protein [Syntrophales bacterium LBB04]|nr:4Fe-4S binding protein [Syntrophales bacterium LBB04]
MANIAYRITDKCDGCGACKRNCPVDAIRGNKKALHIIAADRCIECGACGRICPAEAVNDPFGILCAMIRRSLWDKPQFDKRTCMSCRICIDACPVYCLDLLSFSPALYITTLNHHVLLIKPFVT